MTYVGILIDGDVFADGIHEDCMVDAGYDAKLPIRYFINQEIANYNRPEGWLMYMCNRLSWPGQKLSKNLICKVCY